MYKISYNPTNSSYACILLHPYLLTYSSGVWLGIYPLPVYVPVHIVTYAVGSSWQLMPYRQLCFTADATKSHMVSCPQGSLTWSRDGPTRYIRLDFTIYGLKAERSHAAHIPIIGGRKVLMFVERSVHFKFHISMERNVRILQAVGTMRGWFILNSIFL